MNLVTVMNRDGEVVYRFIDFNKYIKWKFWCLHRCIANKIKCNF
jgi:hypothetical protein